MYGVMIIFYPCLAGFHCNSSDRVDERLAMGEAGLEQREDPSGPGHRARTAASTQWERNSAFALDSCGSNLFSLLPLIQVNRAHKDLQRWLFDVVMQL